MAVDTGLGSCRCQLVRIGVAAAVREDLDLADGDVSDTIALEHSDGGR